MSSSLKPHTCKTCASCQVCHKCLQSKACILISDSPDSQAIWEMCETSAQSHYKDSRPQYIKVGPLNEKIAMASDGTPSLVESDAEDDGGWDVEELNPLEDDAESSLDGNEQTVIIDEDDVLKRIDEDDVLKRIDEDEMLGDMLDVDDPHFDVDEFNKMGNSNDEEMVDGDLDFWEPSGVKMHPKKGQKKPSIIKIANVKSVKPTVARAKRKNYNDIIGRLKRSNKITKKGITIKMYESSDPDNPDSDKDDDDFDVPDSLDCKICDKTFTSVKDLKIHQIYHSTEEVHKCTVCGAQFQYSFQLIKHTINHKNPQNICEYCKKEFKTKEKLRVHLASHTGDYAYNCVVCDKGFKDYQRLKSHLLCHMEDKPFVCDKCGKCFRRKSQLKTHSWIHSDVKPFHCSYCEKPFNYKCNMQLHVQRTHNVVE